MHISHRTLPFAALVAMGLVSGCASIHLTPEMASGWNDDQFCNFLADPASYNYSTSEEDTKKILDNEMAKRGITDCSDTGLALRQCEQLGFQKSSEQIKVCAMNLLNVKQQQRIAQQQQQQLRQQLQQQQSMQMMLMGGALLQQANPPPQPVPNTLINCTTQYRGNQAYTHCN